MGTEVSPVTLTRRVAIPMFRGIKSPSGNTVWTQEEYETAVASGQKLYPFQPEDITEGYVVMERNR